MLLITVPILMYQLMFVLILFVASRFGKTPLTIALVCTLLWTATHVFLLPLALFQATVIVISYLVFSSRMKSEPARQ